MGSNFNKISIDENPRKYEDFENAFSKKNETKQKYLSNIKGWKIKLLKEKNDKITIESLKFKNFKEFLSNECYIFLHLFSHNKINKKEEKKKEEKIEKKGEEKFDKLLQSGFQCITPRGLEFKFSNSPLSSLITSSVKKEKNLKYHIYFMCGKESNFLVKCKAMNICYELERCILKNENRLSNLFYDKNLINLSSLFSIDVKKLDLYYEKLHIFRFIYSNFNEEEGFSFSNILNLCFLNTKNRDEKDYERIKNEEDKKYEKYFKLPKKQDLEQEVFENKYKEEEIKDYLEKQESENMKLMSGDQVITFYRQILSNVHKGLVYVSSHVIAQKKELLKKHKVFNIINASKIICPNYFEDDKSFNYLDFILYDKGSQSLFGMFLDVIEFVENALKKDKNSKFLFHCFEGVSRSPSLAISYIMWKENYSYNQSLQLLKTVRKCVSPNAGFIVQLFQWEDLLFNVGKRVMKKQELNNQNRKIKDMFLFRISQLSSNQIGILVPKICCSNTLDSRTTFILISSQHIFTWIGSQSSTESLNVAVDFVKKIQTYILGNDKNYSIFKENEESEIFWEFYNKLDDNKIENEYKDLDYSDLNNVIIEDEEYEYGGMDDLKEETIEKDEQIEKADENEDEGEDEVGSDEEYEEGEEEGEELDMKIYGDAKLYSFPTWEEYFQFDSDDVYDNPSKIFVLLTNNKKHIFVWIGTEVILPENYTPEKLGNEKGKIFIEHFKLSSETKISVATELNDNYEVFFKYFNDG